MSIISAITEMCAMKVHRRRALADTTCINILLGDRQ